jgi:hypothetical protein
MRSRASALGPLLLVLLALGIATGCNSYLVDEGDPNAPVLVQGRVVDASGGGMSGARIQVSIEYSVSPAETIGYEATFRAGLDGTFVVRLAPDPELIEHVGPSGGVVSFKLVVFADAAPFTFQRELRNGTWAGAVPEFVFGPDGVTTPGGEDGMPTLAPAGA